MESFRWAFNLACWNVNKNELIILSKCLKTEDKARILKYHFMHDAKTALVSSLLQCLLKYKLEEYYGHKINVYKSLHGKPYFNIQNDVFAYKSYYYNVSHHGNLVILASSKYEIGVDVMSLNKFNIAKNNNVLYINHCEKDLKTYFHTMQAIFTANEWKRIKSYNNPQIQLSYFLLNWCLKESYIKALGERIRNSLLQSIDFTLLSLNAYLINIDSMNIDDPLVFKFGELVFEDNKMVEGVVLRINKVLNNRFYFQIGTLCLNHVFAVCYDTKNFNEESLANFIHSQPSKFEFLTIQNISKMLDQYPESMIDEEFAQNLLNKP